MGKRGVKQTIDKGAAAEAKAKAKSIKALEAATKAAEDALAEAKALKAERSLLLTALAKKQKAGTATQEEVGTLNLYRSLPRVSEMKDKILALYAKDKKCLFYNDIKTEVSNIKSETKSSLKGFATEF